MKKIFMAAIFCAFLIFGNTSYADNAGMQALREAMHADVSDDNRVFHQDILFFVPSFQGELEIFGMSENTQFKSSGELHFWATMDNGISNELNIPFYMIQNAKDMKIYFQMDKKWYQFQSPMIAAAITDMLATPTYEECEEMISQAKDVTILRETENQRTMLVKVDGNKVADSMQDETEKNVEENISDSDKIAQDKFFNYLDTALRSSDIWYTWTVNKNDWRTITFSMHLSNLVQEFARAALADNDQVWDDTLKNMFETVAYYSEAKAYTTFLNSDARKKIEIPKNVLKAKPVEHLMDAGKK